MITAQSTFSQVAVHRDAFWQTLNSHPRRNSFLLYSRSRWERYPCCCCCSQQKKTGTTWGRCSSENVDPHLILLWGAVQFSTRPPEETQSVTVTWINSGLMKHGLYVSDYSELLLSESHQNTNQVIVQVRSLHQLVIQWGTHVFGGTIKNYTNLVRFPGVDNWMMRKVPDDLSFNRQLSWRNLYCVTLRQIFVHSSVVLPMKFFIL